MTDLPIAIIGGGVSGTYAASLLAARGRRCILFESRPALGGRALSVVREADAHGPRTHFDLGPAWYWPDAQPTITALVDRLGLPVFPQYADGAMRVERFRLEAPQSFVPDAGTVPDAMRFRDGVQSLVAALSDSLPAGTVRCASRVIAVARDAAHGVVVRLANGEEVRAASVILALPLRLVANRITFDPPLPAPLVQLMQMTPTWMAPHAKLLAVYPTPFWRAAGFSGMVSSFVGPMQEIHDASPEQGLGALFGFVGLGAGARAALGEATLRERGIAQLVRLFGAAAESPLNIYLKDWATDADTTTPADLEPAMSPHGPGGALLSELQWEGHLALAGAESSDSHPGYLEGAVCAAERAVAALMR
ncbi:MAG: FAD-dependent oxidoreductase [Gemmatimonadaceae bacterium]|nr:FAD-dependent oxidoreductase [Gemmatimonadaceae bacterium]